jgi:hypothetical protein
VGVLHRVDRLHIVTRVVTALLVAGAALASVPTVVPVAVVIDGRDYPDPLRLDDGAPVADVATWESTRRPEILAAFAENVYGESLPQPTAQTFDVAEQGGHKTVTIRITGPEGSGSFTADLYLPEGTPRGTFLMIDHRGSDPGGSSDYVPTERITKAGFALAHFDANAVAQDGGDYRSRMIDLFHPADQPLPKDAGRAVSAWAWGASRVMDYLQTDPDVAGAPVAVLGHSRSGKAALWAGAQDTRFAAAITNDSGSTGTKLARRDSGESVARINESFPHWFPETYKAFGDDPGSLPVDQHQLLSLLAPRTVLVGSADGDANADPEGEFLSYRAAAPVFALYGLGETGLPSDAWPPARDTPFRGPAMGYHLRSGDHGLTAADWDVYLTVFDSHQADPALVTEEGTV